jgi:hypothetical protein
MGKKIRLLDLIILFSVWFSTIFTSSEISVDRAYEFRLQKYLELHEKTEEIYFPWFREQRLYIITTFNF